MWFLHTVQEDTERCKSDVFEVFPDGSSIKIDQVRNVVSSFAKRPVEAFTGFVSFMNLRR